MSHLKRREHTAFSECYRITSASVFINLAFCRLGQAAAKMPPKKRHGNHVDIRKMAHKLLDHQPVATFVFKYKPLGIRVFHNALVYAVDSYAIFLARRASG
jgi:hypothetical protein